MTQPSEVDRNYKREIVLRAAADAAWSLTGSVSKLDDWIQAGIVTKEEICMWFGEELDKLA